MSDVTNDSVGESSDPVAPVEGWRAAAARAAEEWFSTIGYEPPPHQLELPPVGETPAPMSGGLSPLTLSRIRSRPAQLAAELRDLDPMRLAIDPFVGDSRSGVTDFEGLRLVVAAEQYVAATTASVVQARRIVTESSRDLEASSRDSDATAEARDLERRARENLEHARARSSALEATKPVARPVAHDETAHERRMREADDRIDQGQWDGLSQRYASDMQAARAVLDVLQFDGASSAVTAAVVDFGMWTGEHMDHINAVYALGTLRRRRRRRRLRIAVGIGLSVVLAGLVWLTDQAIAGAWFAGGSAIFAGVMIVVDRMIDGLQRRRFAAAQLEALARAVEECTSTVEGLKRREIHLNAVRGMCGLPPLRLVDDGLLAPLG
ncbi:hypothetical protein GCM10010460_16160 [Microbacterium terrae]|uniref:Uncharacterized protein n=2 Tax=Microbacterium terrae TaxID=69369 RepID=A0A0M2HGJ8_9MICO|nr:hypothetical protein RS81_00675 [Microbacterium terrae]GLJ98111.1 hypothetical protein GCM10017594_13080 [Microbacterium terrae]